MASVLDSPAPAAPPAAPPKITQRDLGDIAATRDLLFNNVLSAAQAFEPVTNQRHTLSLHDVAYAGPTPGSKKDRKRAVLTRDTLSRQLQGTWRLTDNATGQELAHKRTTIARVPYMTDDGTFVYRGNEWTGAHQMRLLPGIFVRRKENGELEGHVNVSKGLGHRVYMDPETGVFRIGIGQAQIPLLPLLRAMGVQDDVLRKQWGNDLLAANTLKDNPQAIHRLYQHVGRKGEHLDEKNMRQAVADAFRAMELSPEVTKRTLKKAFTNVDENTLLAVANKLIKVNNEEDEPDDRDHMAFQTVLGPEDLFAERIKKARGVARQLLWKATARGNLDHVGSNTFGSHIDDYLTGSGLFQPLEQINPAETFDQQTRVTRMGEGGISDPDAVPDEARSVQPSQFGFIDFIRSPERGNVGVDQRLARGIRKGTDGRLYAQFQDPRTGKTSWKSPQDVADSIVAFPEEMNNDSPYVYALVNGKVKPVLKNHVQYVVPNTEDTFSPLSNLVPMKSTVKGQRLAMSARYLTQALPLVGGEAPFVQSAKADDPERSYDEEYSGRLGAINAAGPAQVVSVTPDEIVLQDAKGQKITHELYNNFPFNRKTFIHQTPTVKPGDTVQKGQLLASSNYTDRNGVAAIGRNLLTAYIPWHGVNFEDAVVISESAARDKLRSEHMYQHDIENDPKTKVSKAAYISSFPATFPKAILDNFTPDGIIKPGTTVKYGDPLILAVNERERTHRLLKSGKASFRDAAVTWDHDDEGVVTDVTPTDDGVSVVVKATAPMQVGDKLAGRYGDKGVVAQIVPDHDMPTDSQGRPFELLLNPGGLPSRVNPAQIYETALGKIAAVTGKPYKVRDFKDIDDMAEFVDAELRKHGMTGTEDITDPSTQRKIKSVGTGYRWMMKLHHTSESKAAGRGLGDYTMDETPAKGGDEGAKRVGMLELGALLSHGATQVINDVSLIRGQASPEWWSMYMSGYKPPTPKIPYRYEKFVNYLKASGINVIRDGPETHIMALRNRDIDQMAGERELKNVETVDWKNMEPVEGGLFDQSLTGGHGGNRWAKITLAEPMPNPVMEEPIRRMLGLTKDKFHSVLAGKEFIDGHTGPIAIQRALANVNVPKALEQTRMAIKSNKRGERDAAVRKLKYLKMCERTGLSPGDWVVKAVPVLPPWFRPVSTMGPKKLPLVSDPNYLYKEVFDANTNLKELKDQLGDDVGEERLQLYKAFQAVTGLGDPVHPKNRERRVKGILKHVFGNSPKLGYVQRRLLGAAVDLVGRAVITPNPDLDMDSVGLPEDRAWDIYQPIVVRSLVRRGMQGRAALRAIEERQPVARQALLKEMETRPVIINRAPTLHRFGFMAAYPRLVKGNTLQVSPLIVNGFNADFDGDQMNYHVPVDDDAAKEAIEKMLPSRNLISPAHFGVVHKPTNEYIGGLYEASARVDQRNAPAVFETVADAVRAYKQGRIDADRQVHIMKH